MPKPVVVMPAALRRFLVGAALVIAPAASGHGDDHVLIEALTEELAKTPQADLFIRRGELFRHHGEWSRAEADFVAAAKLEPELVLVDFFRARLLLEAGEAVKARTFVERYVAAAPAEAEGRFLRGEILAALGQTEAAAAAYADGIARARSPRPEHFLRRAKLLAAACGADVSPVLEALEQGMARLGPIISLVDFAITLELERKNFDAALARIRDAMSRAPRREAWLVRQGDVLVKCGRTADAVASYRAALAEIEELPTRYRETVPVEKLARDARNSLAQLSSP